MVIKKKHLKANSKHPVVNLGSYQQQQQQYLLAINNQIGGGLNEVQERKYSQTQGIYLQ